jgi:hypothetical protein
VPDAHDVRGADAGHLTGIDVPWQVRPQVAGLAGHQLLDPHIGGEEVGDGPAVPHDAAASLHQAERQHDGAPTPELMACRTTTPL